MKETELNQQFTGFDLASFFGLILIVFVIFFVIIRQYLIESTVVEVSRNLISINSNLSIPSAETFEKMSGKNRAIASDSDVKSLPVFESAEEKKLDPWGNPYKFSVRYNSKGSPSLLVVWSEGPNGRLDSDLSPSNISAGKSKALIFRGDDVGSIFVLEHR